MRFVFDECVGKPVMKALHDLLRFSPLDIQFEHVLDYQLSGITDEVWIPRVAEEGGVLITGDGGRQGRTKSKGRKLTHVCFACKMTHIVLSPQLHDEPNERKARFLAAVWDDIVKTPTYDHGSRFSLRRRQQNGPPVLLYIPTDDVGAPLRKADLKHFRKNYTGPVAIG